MGYHKNEIHRGKVGQISKIIEEFEELVDAREQGDKIMQICELSDLVGAIEEFALVEFNLTLVDLIRFSDKTKQAFKEGTRK